MGDDIDREWERGGGRETDRSRAEKEVNLTESHTVVELFSTAKCSQNFFISERNS